MPLTAAISHGQALHGKLTIGSDVWIRFSQDKVHLIEDKHIS